MTATKTTRVSKVVPATPKQVTKVALILDRSGSMGGIVREAERAFADIMDGIKNDALKFKLETRVTFVTFNGSNTTVFENVPSAEAPNNCSLFPSGNTAMLDAIGDTITLLQRGDTPETSYLVYVVTDGETNADRRYTSAGRIRDLILPLVKSERWTFGFQMPKGHKHYAAGLGVPDDHIREWETTAAGMIHTGQVTNVATSNFYAAKSAGGTRAKVSDLFTTDLSGLSAKVLKTKLDDISSHFKEFEVKDESRINEFTAKKTKKEYVTGQTFYMLMKKETIQASKRVLIKEKGKEPIWGGDQARELIGLPLASSGVSIKVEPGNHGNYDVFIQSTSPNRKLPRGTKILVDTTLKVGLAPTWDTSVLKTIVTTTI